MTDFPSPSPASADPPPKATLREVVAAVFWSFFGVRKGNAMRRDEVAIRPVQVIVVGIVLAALLVVGLLVLVQVILRSAAA